MKTFWMSFADPKLPRGQQFLGVAVVDVTVEEAADIADEIHDRFPRAKAGAEWMAAATRKSWALGCNPGGSIAFAELSADASAGMPRNRLLTRQELAHFGCELSEQ